MTQHKHCSGQSRRHPANGNPRPEQLRALAENRVGALEPQEIDALPPEEARRIFHELRVHQVELEMQNEELRRAQEQLAASRDRYYELYDLAPVGYCTIGEEGLIQEANLTAATLLNVERCKLVKQPLSRFIGKEDQDIYYLKRKLLLKTGEPQAFELRMLREDGLPFWVRMESTVAHDEAGTPVLRVVMSDISERKEAEEEREKMRAQLHQAQKLEAVGRLAGGVAHDFNNMLGIIIGHAEMALDEMAPEDSHRDELIQIEKAAKRSAQLTRQLLAFARKQTISPRILDLNETASGIMTMLRRLIGEDIDLQWKPGPGVWPVKMDPSQIDQVLANLAVNSRYAIEGVGTLAVETANVTFDEDYCRTREGGTPGDYVMLAVSDTGAGMDRETLDHLFEPFFTTREVGKGTGLGLATVYGIIRQNGGFIDVYSKPGQGATFRIYLPRAWKAVPVEAGPIAGKNLGGNETVLLVEDEQSILKMGKRILDRYGYQVLAASSPEEALRMARDHPGPIHLLITDVVMPQMSGKDLKDQLQVIKPGFKCFFMSGYTRDIIARRGVLDEGIDFLEKPFSVKTLAEKVREVLGA